MQFIDEAKITIKAGNGGHGCASFRREKYIDRGGPDGGDGGAGGSIIFESSSHINTLLNYRFKRHFKAENGEYGKGQNRTGKSREPLILKVPVGTQICSIDGLLTYYDFTKDNETFVILEGGHGGLGNSHFKSSTNQSPRKRTEGEIGGELEVSLQLKLLSDAGLVGLPNAGKSTFLKATTSAKPKIADYQFTTLKPGLGVVYVSDEEFVMADIPGLISGAHQGSGLGDKFLKHIQRCSVLVHLIDATSENILKDYQTIRAELEAYSKELAEKPEVICLNKIDLLSGEKVDEKIAQLKGHTSARIFAISGYSQIGTQEVLKHILQMIKDYHNRSDIN